MSDAALEIQNVSKKFRRGEIYDSLRDLIPALTGRMFRARADGELDKRDFWALNDVSFDVKQGEAFGIIGDNGAGKSTMLKLLTGIMRPTKGRITVRGRLSALIEVSAGFHQDLTGRENIYLNGAILGLKRDEITRRFDEIVAFSGLEAFIDTPVKRYSSGMFARLGFSVAAHVDPEVLLVDEVLSVGDYSFQRKCIERMDQIILNGTTVVFISHNLRAVGQSVQAKYAAPQRCSRDDWRHIGGTEAVPRGSRAATSEPGTAISRSPKSGFTTNGDRPSSSRPETRFWSPSRPSPAGDTRTSAWSFR